MKLDNAIRSHFRDKYDNLYTKAMGLLQEFNSSVGGSYLPHEREDFQSLVMRGEKTGGIPDDEDILAEFLLPKILKDFSNPHVVRQYNRWVNERASKAAI